MLKKALPDADTIIVNCDFNKQLLADIAGREIAERAQIVRHFAEMPVVANPSFSLMNSPTLS